MLICTFTEFAKVFLCGVFAGFALVITLAAGFALVITLAALLSKFGRKP
jgi:hypothetical protein